MAYSGKRTRRTTNARAVQRNARVSRQPGRSLFASVNWERVRYGVAGVLFLSLWAVLWGRAAYVQLFQGETLAERARRQHTHTELVTGQRGNIMDRNGQTLARNVECRSVYVNPREVVDKDHTANTLAELTGVAADRIRASLEKDRVFVWIVRKVDDATAAAVRAASLPGVGLVREYERIYPFKQVAGQLLGFTDVDTAGREGLERAFDDSLSGMSARRTVRRDGAGRRFYVEGDDVPSGRDLHLTVDVQVQFMVEEALAEAVRLYEARWAGALVVEVESGDILAWAQYPFFNPNNYRGAKPAVYRNRLALDALEPGSTLKPLLMASALQEGIITRDTVFDCEGGLWKTGRTVIRDDNRVYGAIPVHQILSVSSNIGSAKIGLKLGAAKYHQYLSRLGFGQRAGLHVAESKGILHKVRDWSETDTMAVGFGQGMAATTVQMAQAYLTLGNGGVYKPLRLVRDGAGSGDGLGPELGGEQGGGQRIFSEKVSREVLEMMREVVEEGTGKRAAIPGLAVAGKTGTAQKADKTGRYGDQRTASFVGFVPADAPKFLVMLFIDEPQRNRYGGVIAAPVFKNVMLRTLAYHGMPPDLPIAETPAAPGSPAAKKQTKQADAGKKGKQGAKGAAKQEDKHAKASGLALLAPELESGVEGEFRYDMTGKVREAAGTTVPDVVGKSVRRAVELFMLQGVVPEVRGEGSVVVRQSPVPGSTWPGGQGPDPVECILWISEK